jgi:hypothetical protein
MFTPPPSPRNPLFPTGRSSVALEKVEACASPLQSCHSPDTTKRVGRRIKWMAILVPLTLILITLSLRYVTHPAALDLLLPDLPSPSGPRTWKSCLSDWSPHIRHRRQSAPTSSISFPGGSPTASAAPSSSGPAQSLPTIPSTPPVLPTPFPRPFDTSFTRNFTNECYGFFVNISSAPSFLSCRPFSLLLQSSQQFIEVS